MTTRAVVRSMINRVRTLRNSLPLDGTRIANPLEQSEVNRMKKVTIALSLLLALSTMAGCSVYRNHYGWERRHWEWHDRHR